MWEVVPLALTTMNSGCWCPCPHCVMTMRQRGDCNVGNCVLGIDSDEFMMFVSIPTLCDAMRQRGDGTVGNCGICIDNDEFRLLVSIPTLCDYNAATG